MALFRSSPQIDQVFEKVDEMLVEGMILKVDWEDLKTRINRHFDRKWQDTVKKHCYGNDDLMVRELLDVGYPQLHTLNNRSKKLNKIAKDHPSSPYSRILEAGREIIVEMQMVAPKMEALKENIKTKKEIQEVKNPKPKPKIDPKAKTLIEDTMKKVAEGITQRVHDDNVDNQMRIVRMYEDKVSQLPEGKNQSPYRLFREQPYYRSLLGRLYEEDRITKTHSRVDGFDELIDKEAWKTANFTRDVFVSKQVSKLPAIATGLGDIKSISGTLNLGAAIEANLHLEFEGNKSFDVRTQVVLSTSIYGKPFHRYPTTFHNVTDQDGKMIAKMLSEDEMHEFAGVAPVEDEKINDGPQ
jgi:hypothetical protein